MGFYSKHAIKRASERYGMDLTDDEMWKIFVACRDGKALCGQRDDAGDIFLLRIRDQVVIPALNKAKTTIVTFMPRDYFTSGASRKHRHKMGAKQYPCRQGGANPGYRRERITIQQALEET